jgi:L-fucose mutarotase/ribose pyranase (RbsD/FucU family)
MHHGRQTLPAAYMRPSSMRRDAAMGHGSHVCIVETVFPTKCRKVANGSDASSMRIDKSIVRLYKLALPHAIRMRPALV